VTLVSTRELMQDAADHRTGIGAFNVVHLETAEALVAAAELARRPVILQISQNCAVFHGGLEPVALATLSLARSASVPVAVHLDHAEDEDLAYQAIELGFGSVMFDGAHLSYSENVKITARVTAHAHRRGVFVEAELGTIGGKDGAHAPGVRTDPDEACSFVVATGVDALAVAVGSSHAMSERVAMVDLDLIARLHEALAVPLVLHGSSGVPDQQIVAAIRAGMTKINVSTHLVGIFTTSVREYLSDNETVVDSRKYFAPARSDMADEVARLLRLFSLTTPLDLL
jgi:fructose-bisphosphate aldolase class II